MIGKKRKLIDVVIILVISCLQHVTGCPTPCSCKWKGGKQTVECKNKGLSALPTAIEHGTQVLNIEGNNLKTLPRLAFLRRSLINLQKLHLGSCNIEKINEEAFFQLTNLIELDLSNNLLIFIPSAAFRHTPELRHLNLSGNRIKSILADSFLHVPALVHLDLSNADISTISPLAFKPLALLENLLIQNNNIKELDESAINNIENIHGIRVHGNPWFCDCRTLPLWRLLIIQRVPHPVSPVCNAPHRISRIAFKNLQEEDFACPPEVRPEVKVVKGVAGENATVTCPVEGQPLPDVLWYIGDRPVINGSILGLGPQRVYIVNGGKRNKISYLVITGAQEADSGQIRCIAVNPAGKATANFTLAVTMKNISNKPLNPGHIAGISIGLIVLALLLFIVAFILFARTRSTSSPATFKEQSPVSSSPCSPSEPNPIQKPPRITDLSNSNSIDPDLISEAEKVSRGNQPNGLILNGRENPSSIAEIGDYARMEGDSLYPSSLWNSQMPVLHEHFNPGFIAHESPHHIPSHSSTFQKFPNPNIGSHIYSYPSDYGLPIPESEKPVYASQLIISAKDQTSSRGKTHYIPHDDLDGTTHNIYGTHYGKKQESSPYSMVNSELKPRMRIPENKITSKVQFPKLERELYVAEGAESPQIISSPDERPWIPGSHTTPVIAMGVPVLLPHPSNALQRIKSRDSPDEGYQEGTEV